MSKILITLGVILIIAGLLYPLLQKLGLGTLPGDIFIKKGKTSFYFPIVSCLLVSIIISVIINWFRR